MIDEISADMKPGDKWPTIMQPRANRVEVGRIEQLMDVPGQVGRFFGEPMVGVTVKQHEEYLALRARAAEICSWTLLEGMDAVYGSTCGDTYHWTGGDILEVKFCPTCGRKVEAKP